MNSMTLKQFQEQVSELVLRHRSVLDILSKFQQSGATVNRSVIKSITECGCIQVNAEKQKYTEEMTIREAKELLETHVKGQLCENCMEIIGAEIGSNLFYMSALCNVLNVNLEDVVDKESQKCATLGFFNLS